MNIDQLRLSPTARKAAEFIYSKHPYVIFTSGRRDAAEQAHAMACNVVTDRNWIMRTYLRGAALQTAVDVHRVQGGSWNVSAIESVLCDAMLSLTDAELRGLSRHYTGDAFDIKPIQGEQGHAVLDTIKAMKLDPSFDLEKFLTKEGDLIRWHLQFLASIEV